MARPETGNVIPLVEGWIAWDWFFEDAEDGEPDRGDADTGKVGPDPGKTPRKT